jgi:hypothetical protein
MWIYNSNFGKWSSSNDSLSKPSFDLLKQELSATRFYARILSGATFLPINNFDDIYDILGQWEPRSWYISTAGSIYSDTMTPVRNPYPIDKDTSYEYYTKFISEYGLTLKNLFTADRLIKDSVKNYYYVDLATTTQIDLGSNPVVIDGELLRVGHKVLVKDQRSTDTFLSDVDPATIFMGSYEIIDFLGGTTTYRFPNSDNGIYVFDGKKLVRDTILDDYSNCVRYSVHVGMGASNANKQYHLKRMKNGYYPMWTDGEPVEFGEKHNWLLRNRVDYNNLFEINYYDVIKHGTQSYQIDGVTYSIPPRTVAVGEFGVILNTQNLSGIKGTSNIIVNKYKVNLRSISQTSTHYWVAGDESVLLKVRKHDFLVERVPVDTLSNLTSVSFYDDLRGAAVGELNTILITTNGGVKWDRLRVADFAPYTYNKVLFTEASRMYVAGRNGVFLELFEDISGWTAFKRRIFKEIDDDDEYLLVEGINDIFKTKISTWGLSYSFATHSTATDKELVFLATNNGNIIAYDEKEATEFDFLYLDFGTNYGDIRNITRRSGTNDFYFTADSGLYSFDIGSFKYIGVGNTFSNTIAGTYAALKTDQYANEIFDYEGNELLICGNNSLLKAATYPLLAFDILDDSFESRLKSKMLFMDYDIGAKLNWFTDQGEYRLPNSVTFSAVNAFDSITGLRNSSRLLDIGFSPLVYGPTAPSMATQSETTWYTYWIDDLKTFEYYSKYPLNEYEVSGYTSSMVLISNTFSYASGLDASTYSVGINEFSIYSNRITNDYNQIKSLAPSFEYGGTQSSRYDKLNRPDISQPPGTAGEMAGEDKIKLYLHDYLMILRMPKSSNYLANPGDVFRMESPIVESNFVVNKIWEGADAKYAYMYSEFNEAMITDLVLSAATMSSSANIKLTNLNYYQSVDQLVSNFNKHPMGLAYEMKIYGSASRPSAVPYNRPYYLRIDPKFNSLTSYYNLATGFTYRGATYGYVSGALTSPTVTSYSEQMIYTGGFLKFGYTPTYNLLDYMESINMFNQGTPVFYATKEYLALPSYKDIPLGSLGESNAYIDSNGVEQSGTTGNKILFGEGLRLEWESIMLNTFVDVTIWQPSAGATFSTKRLLVMNKYKIENIDGLGFAAYAIEFQKGINFELGTDFTDGNIDIRTRRTLQEISDDLQELNNIHRAKLDVNKISNDTLGYRNYQRELNFKIPTDSYAKAFLSDSDTVGALSAILYVDYKNELSMNITRLDVEYNIPINMTVDFNGQLFISCSEKHKLSKGEGVVLEFTGGEDSSQALNQNYLGYRVVTETYGEYDFTVELPFGNEVFVGQDSGFVKYVKRDPFLNYQPIDVIDVGLDKKGKVAIELSVENTKLVGDKFRLVDVDMEKYRFRMIDGLNIETISVRYPWILEAEVSGAVLGLDADNSLVWYKGIWEGGRWFGGTWMSGTWKYGDWYAGTWNSKTMKDRKIAIEIDENSSDEFQSVWFTGRWFDGTWNNGTWANGRFYDGEWNAGVWNNGIWNDGIWNGGRFIGGIWVEGEWNGGIFNTDNEPAYWLDGDWRGGDFENGMWYNGSFESKVSAARFGTKAYNSRTATWHGGKWLSGSFYSKLGPAAGRSEVHKYSMWYTGQWMSGDFYGGIAYNIDFKSGTWHGGILEDIQIIGMNENNNSFILNGIFKFNIGDEIWVIDNGANNDLSDFGSDEEPTRYTVLYTVEDSVNRFTEVYLATNIRDFSGKFLSFRKKNSTQYAIGTNAYATSSISVDDAQTNLKDIKVKINMTSQNNIAERPVPVAQLKTTVTTFPSGLTAGNIIPGSNISEPLNLPAPGSSPATVATASAGWETNWQWNKQGLVGIFSATPSKIYGTNTFFTKQVAIGSTIYLRRPQPWIPPRLAGTVTAILSDTELTIQNNYVADFLYPYGNTFPFRSNTNNEVIAFDIQSTFLSQNMIGLRQADETGKATFHWGLNPTSYFGPGSTNDLQPMSYALSPTMSANFGSMYEATNKVLDPVSRDTISYSFIPNGTTYSADDEVYSYAIEVSESHTFEQHYGIYNLFEVGLVYQYVATDLEPGRYYYYRITEVRSSGMGSLKINLMNPQGAVVGVKQFNKANTDTNMIETVFTYDQDSPDIDTGAPTYQGSFRMGNFIAPSMNTSFSTTSASMSMTASNGNWTLYVENTSGINTALLKDWEIQFGYADTIGAKLYDRTPAVDTKLRVVSKFRNSIWKTGIWTNGIFEKGLFESGIWYKGVFDGTWG